MIEGHRVQVRSHGYRVLFLCLRRVEQGDQGMQMVGHQGSGYVQTELVSFRKRFAFQVVVV